MQIWVDADACPKAVRGLLIKTSSRMEIKVTFVSNQYHRIPSTKYIKVVQVSGGFDVADEYIIQKVSDNDLVITSDIPLAAAVVNKNAFVLSPRGKFLNTDNINEALTMRNLKEELRSTGIDTGKQKPFSHKDIERFANQLDQFMRKNRNKSSHL